MENIITVLLLLAILGVSVACLVKKDKKCNNSRPNIKVGMSLGDDAEILPPNIIDLMVTGNWQPSLVCKKLNINVFQIGSRVINITGPFLDSSSWLASEHSTGKTVQLLYTPSGLGPNLNLMAVQYSDGSPIGQVWKQY